MALARTQKSAARPFSASAAPRAVARPLRSWTLRAVEVSSLTCCSAYVVVAGVMAAGAAGDLDCGARVCVLQRKEQFSCDRRPQRSLAAGQCGSRLYGRSKAFRARLEDRGPLHLWRWRAHSVCVWANRAPAAHRLTPSFCRLLLPIRDAQDDVDLDQAEEVVRQVMREAHIEKEFLEGE